MTDIKMKNCKADSEDWRLLRGQEEYLRGVTLIWHEYQPKNPKNDHDHCEFCMEKFGFSEDDIHFGYSTEDNDIWICEKCFEDFKEAFGWKVSGADNK